jgi:hypothetical protein
VEKIASIGPEIENIQNHQNVLHSTISNAKSFDLTASRSNLHFNAPVQNPLDLIGFLVVRPCKTRR